MNAHLTACPAGPSHHAASGWNALSMASIDGSRPLANVQYPFSGWLAIPFDAARAQYGTAVEFGLLQRSILAGGRFERALDALERISLGPFARRV